MHYFTKPVGLSLSPSLSIKNTSKIMKILFVSLFLATTGFSQTKIVGYMPSWNDYGNNFDYTKVTHINIHSAIPDADGYLSYDAINTTILQQAHAKNVKVFIVLGDANYSNYVTHMNNTNRASFVQKIVNYVNTH